MTETAEVNSLSALKTQQLFRNKMTDLFQQTSFADNKAS